jgi:hypothetical protein
MFDVPLLDPLELPQNPLSRPSLAFHGLLRFRPSPARPAKRLRSFVEGFRGGRGRNPPGSREVPHAVRLSDAGRIAGMERSSTAADTSPVMLAGSPGRCRVRNGAEPDRKAQARYGGVPGAAFFAVNRETGASPVCSRPDGSGPIGQLTSKLLVAAGARQLPGPKLWISGGDPAGRQWDRTGGLSCTAQSRCLHAHGKDGGEPQCSASAARRGSAGVGTPSPFPG